MVPGFNPVIILLKTDVPAPSLVLVLSAMVGFGLVLQQTPFSVMVQLLPPLVIPLPPLIAEEPVTEPGKVVLSEGVPTQLVPVVVNWKVEP